MNSVVREDINLIINSFPDWEFFRNKRVLVTGANGMLPSYMIDVLMSISNEFGITIIGLVRNLEKSRMRLGYWFDNSNFQLFIHDVNIPFEYNGKIDIIIHAASQASPKFYGADPIGTLSTNTIGTMNMLELAYRKEVEVFLYFSSGEIYGELTESQIPTIENMGGYIDSMNVRSCYAESKRMGENICASYLAQKDVNVKIVRPFHTYGPGMALDDGRVYADFLKNCLLNEDICIRSDGKARRAFCYLTDATLGFFTVLVKGIVGEAYNVGNPNEEHSISELAEILLNIFPEKNLKIRFDKNSSQSTYLKSPITRNTPSTLKIEQLGWLPSVAVNTGFKRTYESYKNSNY